MATDDSERTLNKQIAMGDIVYDITVKRFSEGIHRATWTCSACKEEGAWAPVSADPAQALASASIGIDVHHAFVHGASKLNPPHSTRKPVDQPHDRAE
jgi:hypothetical protein